MYTLLMIIFLSLPILVIFFLASLKERHKKQIKKDLKKIINQLAKENKLQVAEIHIFHRKAITIDRKNRKLVFVNLHGKFIDQICIDLRTIIHCRVAEIKGELSKDIEKVFVEVKNKGVNKVSKLVFYDRYFDNIHAKAGLIREAEYWRNKINHQRSMINSSFAYEYVL